MAEFSEYSEQILEAGAMLNAASEFLVNQPDTPVLDLSKELFSAGPTGCVTKLVASVALASSYGTSDSLALKSLGRMLLKPVAEFFSALEAVFVPDASQFEGLDGQQIVTEFLNQVLEAMKNPFAAMLQMQSSIMQRSLDQFSRIFYNADPNSKGIVNEYYDRGVASLRGVILGEKEGIGLAGLILYAFDEMLPAVENQLVYLRVMRKQLNSVVEDIANLPDAMQPQLPNFAITSRLCDVEDHLRRVENRLRSENIFDRAAFTRAEKGICASRDMIFDGSLDSEFFTQHASAFTGFSAVQLDQLKTGKFLPNAGFSFRLAALRLLREQVVREDDHIRRFHQNLLGLIDQLKTLADTRLGDIMSLFVAMLRLQIGAVRADLEAQGQGFNGYIDARYEAMVRAQADARNTGRGGFTTAEREVAERAIPNSTADGGTKNVLPNGRAAVGTRGLGGTDVYDTRTGAPGTAFSQQSSSVYSYVASQGNAYIILSAACFIAGRISQIHTVLNQLLNAESTVVRAIQSILNKYKGEQCGDGEEGVRLSKQLDVFINAARARLDGRTNDNRYLTQAAQDLRKKIDEYEAFLVCFRTNLFFGNEKLAEAVSQAIALLNLFVNVSGLIRRIRLIAQQFSQYKEMLKNLDIAKLLGLDFLQVNAIDALFAALQCLMLNCPNTIVSEIANTARREFQSDRNKYKSNAITMGALDEIPKAGSEQRIFERINAILRLVRAIQDLTNLDLNKLCSIQTAPLRSSKRLPDGSFAVQNEDPDELKARIDAAQKAYAQQKATMELARQARAEEINPDRTSVSPGDR